MMEESLMKTYASILQDELVPAMGCTEPIAVAYAAALTRKTLGTMPERVDLTVSPNIIKNVKSVVVPNTGGLQGIPAAAAAGIWAGDPDAKLEVLSRISQEEIPGISVFMEQVPISIQASEGKFIFEILVELYAQEHSARVRFAGNHTNVIYIEKDGQVLLDVPYEEKGEPVKPFRDLLTVEKIVEFADTVPIEMIRPVLERQIAYNTAIAEEGLRNNWGASIGKILLTSYGNTISNRAKALAAAGSDARMSGCEMPVIINSGSGNQGMTTSLPVIAYARELGCSDVQLLRALAVANLITIHMKTGIGCLSAYCGATSAGCGAAAGIRYLYGGHAYEISHTIVNAVAINSGMICDGAKPSCAAKIASAVEAGLLGMQMQMHGTQFYGGQGIVVKGVENTIAAVGRLARQGMAQTDKEIIKIMIQ